jgi:hypothetical protein
MLGVINYKSLLYPKKGYRGCKGPKYKKDDSNNNNGAPKTDSQPARTTIQSQLNPTYDTPQTTQFLSKSSVLSTLSSLSEEPILTLKYK